MTMSWRSGGWTLASAVLWMAVGVAGTLLFNRETGVNGTGGNTAELAAALQSLDLSEQQRREVDQVIAAYGDSVLTLHGPVQEAEARFWSQVLNAEQEADQAIAMILTEDQRRRYEDLILGRSDDLGRSGNDNRR